MVTTDRYLPTSFRLINSLHHNLIWSLLVCVALVCLSTRLLSGLRSRSWQPAKGQEPPVAPYWLPYLQHLPSFLSNPNRTFESWSRRYLGTPFTLLMMNTKFHVFSSSTTASHIFSRSRDFVFEPVVASMMENGVNLPTLDRPKFQLPLKPHHLLTDSEQRSREFLSANHTIYLKYLTSVTLDMVMNTYMAKLQHVSADLFPKDGSGWVTIDYHELMRKTIFETSVLTFFGTRLHEIWPDMWEDWKLFNDATFAGVRSNVSWYLRPKARAARERMLQAFDEWVDTEIEEWPETQSIWNDKWGIKMNWEREILGRKFEFTHRGRACLQASFLFVIVTNSAPMATWFTICIFKSPGGVARYREEIASSVKCTDGIGQDEFPLDVLKLKQSQYIQGVWKESLRTGSASAAARVVTKEAEIDGFIVKPGSVLLLPVQLLHFDHDVFPQPQQIDPNRWITNDAKDEEKYRQIQKQNSHLRSFGGGTGLCSGRFVAEQEIINVVSTVLFLFDLEFVKPIEGLDLNPQSIGIMNPKRNPTVRLRRRKLKV